MNQNDFINIVKRAWIEYDSSRMAKKITDISAKVSTNHVYKIELPDRSFVIAKLSYFGRYDDFIEDHTIVNALANNLPYPFENVLSRSLVKGAEIFIHRYTDDEIDAAVVFYRPVNTKGRPPKRLEEDQIIKLGKEMAKFHKACHTVRHTLPYGSKSLKRDIGLIEDFVQVNQFNKLSNKHQSLVLSHCAQYKNETAQLDLNNDDMIPVFIDWNIGNFSLTRSFKLYSRWDYDWFRTSTRVMDFYFLSRVVSDVGDRTVFQYNVGTLIEERFKLFLKHYHKVFPLTKDEVKMIKEAYRFFILNYVVRHGDYFFNKTYAQKLKQEALDIHLPSLDRFSINALLRHLDL